MPTVKNAWLIYGSKSNRVVASTIEDLGYMNQVTILASRFINVVDFNFNVVKQDTDVVIIAGCPSDFKYELFFSFF